MSQLKRVRRVYDRDPAAYHRSMSTGPSGWMLGGRREKVGEAVGEGGKVLDVGFGSGLSLPHYPASAEVIAVDYSLAMLQHASVTAARPVALIQADAEHLPFADQSFDAVAFNLCLCTIPHPDIAVREGIRVARPGARMVFLEHVRSHLLPIGLLQDLLNPLLVALEADHFNRRTAEIVEHAGIQIDRVDRWFGGIFNLIVGRAPANRP